MAINSILMLDDEEGATSDYRHALRSAGVQVVAFTDINKAFEAIKKSIKEDVKQEDRFDFILLDLMLSGQKISLELKACHNNLKSQMHNEGQALGQWLWECGGAHAITGRPVHCYFSNVPSVYSFSNASGKQEFFAGGKDFDECEQKNLMEAFVLNKLEIKPSVLKQELERVKDCWVFKKLIK